MSIKLSEFQKETKECKVIIGDNELNVKFKLNFYTSEFEDMLFNISKDKTDEKILEAQVYSLLNIITDWDFVDDKGKKLPVTKENIKQIPGLILFKISNAISEAANPNEQTSNNSKDM